jgi:DNA-binding NarL/FixJ family response regulator
VDHKDHRSIGTLIAVGHADLQQGLVDAFVAADIPAPQEAGDAATLRATLAGAGLDLIVMSSHLEGDYVAPMISEVRRGKLGPHPFPIVIVLADESDPASLRQISNCGPDDIILLPCEPEDLLDRINVFLTGGRRPLVVTPGYAGPERRARERVTPT